jgi:predicted alpha-1,6-mannanase (GH76 family)
MTLEGFDHTHEVLERIKSRMSEQGVVYSGQEGNSHTFEGLGNKRKASITIPSQAEKPTEEQAESIFNDMVADIKRQMGGKR